MTRLPYSPNNLQKKLLERRKFFEVSNIKCRKISKNPIRMEP